MAVAKRDVNRITTLIGVSSIDLLTPTNVAVNPITGALLSDVTIDTSLLATAAKQDTGNTSLSSLDTKTPALGQALASASTPVVLTAAQISTLTPVAAITNFANETGGNLASIKTNTDKIPALGQALASASVPIVLTAAQLSTLTPVSAVTATLAAETVKVIGTVNIASAQTLATVTTVGAVTSLTNALPAGSNAIGKLAANDGIDIGDVTINNTSIAVTQATGTNLHMVIDSGTVDTELPAAALLADATVNPTTPAIGSLNEVYNGTTWDLMREIASSTNSTGTGIQAVGLVAQFDDTDTSTVTENQFANVRLTARRALLTEGENDGYQRRLNEANLIENMKTGFNTIIASESENSQRMGYEIR